LRSVLLCSAASCSSWMSAGASGAIVVDRRGASERDASSYDCMLMAAKTLDCYAGGHRPAPRDSVEP
jgi:hypothetical protein